MFRKKVGPPAPAWSEWIDILATYRAERGHTNIDPFYTTTNGKWLGGWLLSCRRAYAAGTLPAEHAADLRALGIDPAIDPGRKPEPAKPPKPPKAARTPTPPRPPTPPRAPRGRPEPNWDLWLAEVAVFRDIHGHTNIPGHYITPEGRSLGPWLTRVRKSHRNGTLRPAVAEALTTIGYDVTKFGRQPAPSRPKLTSWKPAGW